MSANGFAGGSRSCGDLADALAVEETRLLPLVGSGLPVDDRDAMARPPGMLRRLLAALQSL
ncbi:hypothetical protein [Saccharopolyspora sp. ASAGF58]|uniref:hypothetical protein n=1 Tax=Saccharopolyspora sp. ASAGF58 TaxID=2719023 RepID=UPI00143FDE2E|nr:hypothetical protein [Saccharopolyspora sp. ASAGF58]QIZ37475.1 hypothetical protein FDZ84_26400 [Saccharopolyspora sp. ASAGF58]